MSGRLIVKRNDLQKIIASFLFYRMTFPNFFPIPFLLPKWSFPFVSLCRCISPGHFAVPTAEKCTNTPWQVGAPILAPIFANDLQLLPGSVGNHFHLILFHKACSGVSKMIFTCVKRTNTKIQIHKYSKWSSDRKTQHMVYFWTEDWSRISKIILLCAERTNTKYKPTNTQIHKHTNTVNDQVLERSNMWYIF